MSGFSPEAMKAGVEAAREATRKACDEAGHTLQALLKDLKRERSWKETKTIKIKGYVDPKTLPKGFKIITTSGVIIRDEEGNPIAGDGDTLIMWQEKSGGIRQKARMDAHELRGDYPAKELKHSGSLDLNRPLTPEELKALQEDLNGDKP